MKALLLLLISAVGMQLYTGCSAVTAAAKVEDAETDSLPRKLLQHCRALKEYATANHANATYGVLIDMSLPSSHNRFFVVNLQRDSVLFKEPAREGAGLARRA